MYLRLIENGDFFFFLVVQQFKIYFSYTYNDNYGHRFQKNVFVTPEARTYIWYFKFAIIVFSLTITCNQQTIIATHHLRSDCGYASLL